MGRKSSIRKIQRDNSESKNIQASIMMDLYLKGYSPVVANFTCQGLSECDVLAVSKADLMYEFEIKISRSDFKKDFTKEHKHKLLLERKATKSYDRWVKGKRTDEKDTYILIPNYFVYLVPYGLVSPNEVPEYAGLMYVLPDYKGFEWAKKPPKLHDVRMDDRMLRSIAHNLMCKFIFGSSYQTFLNKNNQLLEGYINKDIQIQHEEDNELPGVLTERGAELRAGGPEGENKEGPESVDDTQEGREIRGPEGPEGILRDDQEPIP